jgi:serine/threonine-protein kinase
VSEASVLVWLDRLLDSNEQQRAEFLRQLLAEDPQLHARVQRLLTSAATPDMSSVLVRPVLGGLNFASQHETHALKPEQSIAGYRLLRELGRGGMSVVWLAERLDGVIKREVALKLPLVALTSPLEIDRFAREKDVLAALAHPHIARLYDAGVTASGQPFIVLERVDGLPITVYCDQHRMTLNQRLNLFLQMLAAVDHAHKHLVVHRDLKPSNVLVDQEGQVKLLDFGIAKLLTDPTTHATASDLTQAGSVLTPLYAAPEQVTGQAISTLTDVYVLGLLLHELLTGQRPHATADGRAPALAELIEKLRTDLTRPSQTSLNEQAAQARALPQVRRLRAALAGDLDTIVQKATRAVPAQRYGSIEHFAVDIRRFLSHRPILARPTTLTRSILLFLRRHQAASTMAAIGSVLVVVSAVIALLQYRESNAHQARTAAVRDFMFDLIDDAEPSEPQSGGQVTGKQMLDGAVDRANRKFAQQPELRGELLSELGRMYLRVGEHDAALRTLQVSLPLLEGAALPDDPSLNKTRAQLASVLLDDGEVAAARKLANQAQSACVRSDPECAKARAYGGAVMSRIHLIEGHPDLALAAIRDSVHYSEIGFGARDPEVAMALLNLALIARNGGRLEEANTAMRRALAVAAPNTMRAADRIELLRTAAVLDLDLGRYAVARTRLAGLLNQTRDADERALQLRLLANVLLEQGEPAQALEAAQSALGDARPETAAAETLFALQAHARALAMLGHGGQALKEIQIVVDNLLRLGRQESSAVMLRARRTRAEILLRSGEHAQAARELDALSKRIQSAAVQNELEWGQILDLQGCALRDLGRPVEAATAHLRALALLQRQLPANHPFLLRNLLYRELAAGNRDAYAREAARLEQALTPGSIWRQLIAAQLGPSACDPSKSPACEFIL